MKFNIDQRLQNDTAFCHHLKLCDLYLMNDRKYPWFILIPRVNNVYDLVDLDYDDQVKLLKEVNIVSAFLRERFGFDKLNVASLGNVVRQLHIHVVARYKNDHSYPDPVWCNNKAEKYDVNEIEKLIIEFNDYYAKR